MKKSLAVAAVALGLAVAAEAADVNFNGTWVRVDYWAGTGSNEAVVVVDFGPSNNFAFGYRWDGSATAWDALAAIDAAGGLTVDATWWDKYQAHFINDFAYGSAAKGAGMSWGYYGSADGNTWSESWVGVDGRSLSDGDWDGWSWGNYDLSTWEHLRPPTTPAPEPGTLTLLALGGAALLRRRKKPGL